MKSHLAVIWRDRILCSLWWMHSSIIVFPKFLVGIPSNFDNGRKMKWYAKTCHMGIQAIVESKLLVLATSINAYDNLWCFHLVINEFKKKKFFLILSSKAVKILYNVPSWYSKTCQMGGIQIIVEPKLLVKPTSNSA